MNNRTVPYIQVKENQIFFISKLHSMTFQNPLEYKKFVLMDLSYHSAKWKVDKKRLENKKI